MFICSKTNEKLVAKTQLRQADKDQGGPRQSQVVRRQQSKPFRTRDFGMHTTILIHPLILQSRGHIAKKKTHLRARVKLLKRNQNVVRYRFDRREEEMSQMQDSASQNYAAF